MDQSRQFAGDGRVQMAWECKWKTVAGVRALVAALAKDDAPTQRALAARLGTTEGTVYAWTVGFRRPGPEYRVGLRRILGISEDLWLTRAERSRLRRLQAA